MDKERKCPVCGEKLVLSDCGGKIIPADYNDNILISAPEIYCPKCRNLDLEHPDCECSGTISLAQIDKLLDGEIISYIHDNLKTTVYPEIKSWRANKYFEAYRHKETFYGWKADSVICMNGNEIKCPKCGGKVVATYYGFKCENKCGMNVGNTECRTHLGKRKMPLTLFQIADLCTGKSITLNRFNRLEDIYCLEPSDISLLSETVVRPNLVISCKRKGKEYYKWESKERRAVIYE